MEIETALDRLRALADQFPERERPSFRSPASPNVIRDFERTVGAPLPRELQEFLLRCDSIVAMGIQNGYWIGGLAELTRSIMRGDFPSTLNEDNSVHVVPVATDGGGNAFLISIDDGRVWRWDHETGENIEVAATFEGFLNRIAMDWENAAAGTEGWHYLV
jgi:cell wall assembly regulator SMI1